MQHIDTKNEGEDIDLKDKLDERAKMKVIFFYIYEIASIYVSVSLVIDEEKNHPCPKEEKANFVHQASIVHVMNDYSIH